VRAIEPTDVDAVARFLHTNLNSGVALSDWTALLRPPWRDEAPNHGFMLIDGESVVGAYAAVYSRRGDTRVCNLAAFCVLEEHRPHGLRLIRALLGQKGYEFTDLSPSGNVVALNERLGFTRLPTRTRLVLNIPGIARGVRVTADPAALAASLGGNDARVYADHRDAPAAHHLLITSQAGHAYLLFRRDRRKGLPLFATPLFVGGNPTVLEAGWRAVAGYLALRKGIPVTLAEHRILGFAPGPGRDLANPRPRMFRSRTLQGEEIDYLYSELTLVRW
jgi:hypothetical protein